MRLKQHNNRIYHRRMKSSLIPFFNLMTTLNVICQACGVAPILDYPHHNRRTLRHLHYIWCAILIIYIHVISYYFTTRVHDPLVTIVKIFFIIELIHSPLLVLLIVFTIYNYAEQYRRIPSEFLRIHKEYQSFQPNVRKEKDLINELHKELHPMLGVICTIIICSLVVDYARSEHSLLYYIFNSSVFNLPNIVITFNLGQYWLSLRFVYHLQRGFNNLLIERLKQFKWDISLMHEDPTTKTANRRTTDDNDDDAFAYMQTNDFSWYKREFNSSRSKSVSECEFLESLRGSYFDLDAVRSQLTHVFGSILFVNIIGSVVSLSVECFAIYKYYENDDYLGDELSQIYHRFLWILIHIGRILLILVANDAIIEEKCRTSFILNGLYISSPEMERSINRFLLRLISHKTVEVACGIVELDSLIITGLLGAMANYIIFLIQIDLGTTTLADLLDNNTKTMNESYST